MSRSDQVSPDGLPLDEAASLSLSGLTHTKETMTEKVLLRVSEIVCSALNHCAHDTYYYMVFLCVNNITTDTIDPFKNFKIIHLFSAL